MGAAHDPSFTTRVQGKGAAAPFPCTPNPRRPASALLRTISLDDSELMPAVGQAILNYLRNGRPQTSLREVFIKVKAPLGPFARGSSLYTVFSRRIRQAGIQTEGKRGPHAIRYARAMSLLRANVSLKSIGDVLGHRSSAATQVYLQLATEDLRSVALAVPGEVE